MFLRTTTLIVAGALLTGCEDPGVNGSTAFHPGVLGTPEPGNQVSGQTAYRHTADRDTTEARTASARIGPSTRDDARAASERVGPSTNADADRAAATADRYPADAKAMDDIRFTAVIDPSGTSLKIVNPSDRDVRDAKVWVNGSYVAWVSDIPPRGTASVRLGDFTDARGQTLSDPKMVRQIQVYSRDGMYNVQGPAFDKR